MLNPGVQLKIGAIPYEVTTTMYNAEFRINDGTIVAGRLLIGKGTSPQAVPQLAYRPLTAVPANSRPGNEDYLWTSGNYWSAPMPADLLFLTKPPGRSMV